jgi:hypothetical protein
MIAGCLWEPTNNVSIVLVMETALATSHSLHHLANVLCTSTNSLIPDNFGISFGGVISDPQ